MGQSVRVIVVNTDEEAAPELRACLLGIEGVKIVAEIDEPAFLAQALTQFPAEALLIHLDPAPAAMMDVVAPLIEAQKDRVVAIAMSEDRDAELVVRAMRAGMREFLWKPFPPEQLAELLARIATDSGLPTRRIGQLVPVFGCTGGIGVTTIATNLAVELAQLESWNAAPLSGAKPKVAVVDLDFRFGQVAMFLDAQPTYTIAELTDSPEHIDTNMIDRAMFRHPSGVHVLAHPPDFSRAERISAAQTAGVLAALQECYDFVVCDGPVRFDPTCRAVFDMADAYLLVLQLLVPAVRNTDRMLQEMTRAGYAMDRVRLVCNRASRETGYLERNDVEATLNRKIDWEIPDDWRTCSTAVNMGATLLDYAPRAKVRLAYRRIAQCLANKDERPPTDEELLGESAPRKGLLSALFAGQKE